MTCFASAPSASSPPRIPSARSMASTRSRTSANRAATTRSRASLWFGAPCGVLPRPAAAAATALRSSASCAAFRRRWSWTSMADSHRRCAARISASAGAAAARSSGVAGGDPGGGGRAREAHLHAKLFATRLLALDERAHRREFRRELTIGRERQLREIPGARRRRGLRGDPRAPGQARPGRSARRPRPALDFGRAAEGDPQSRRFLLDGAPGVRGGDLGAFDRVRAVGVPAGGESTNTPAAAAAACSAVSPRYEDSAPDSRGSTESSVLSVRDASPSPQSEPAGASASGAARLSSEGDPGPAVSRDARFRPPPPSPSRQPRGSPGDAPPPRRVFRSRPRPRRRR